MFALIAIVVAMVSVGTLASKPAKPANLAWKLESDAANAARETFMRGNA